MMRHPCIPVLWLAFLLVLAAPSAWPETSPQFSLPGAPALGDYQVEWLPTYVNLDPNLTRGYHSLVALRFDEALPYLRKVVQRPDVPPGLASEAWTLVGYVHLNRRQGPQAVAAFQRALALAPDNATAHFLLASEYYLDGHHERVRQHLLKAVELRPTFVSARRMLAESFADAGDYAGAVEQYQKVVDMLPGSGYYRYLLYRSQDLAGQLAQAEESLLELIKIEPSFTVNFERLGLLRLKRAQRAASPQERDALLGRAEEAFRALAAAAPQDYRSYLGLARVALERGDYGQARGFLERAGSLAGASHPDVAALTERLDREVRQRRLNILRQALVGALLLGLVGMLVLAVRQARRRQQIMAVLSRFHSGVDDIYEVPELADFSLRFLKESLGLEKASLLLFHRQENRLVEQRPGGGPAGPFQVLTGKDLTNWLLGERRWLLLVRDLAEDRRFTEAFPSLAERLAEQGYEALVTLRERAALVGFLALGRAPQGGLRAHLDLLLPLSQAVSQALERLHLYESSLQDEMTGLANRRQFRQVLSLELRRADRYGQPCSVVTFDIDDFKKVNDTYGHAQGDEILRELANLVRLSVREGIDTAARTGGEEFTLILPATDTARALTTAERLRVSCEEHRFRGPERPLRVTLSMGVATYPDHATTEEELLSLADAAQYAAKRGGKNRVCAADCLPAERRGPRLSARRSEMHITDEVTGLFAASFLALRLGDEVRRSGRSGQPLALLVLGVGAEGEAEDPARMRRLGVLLRENLREGIDVPARLEPGVLAVLAPDIDSERAAALGGRLLERLRQDPAGGVKLHFGVACYPVISESASALAEAAWSAMATARAEGLDLVLAAPMPA